MKYRFFLKAILASLLSLFFLLPSSSAQDGFNPLGSDSPLQLDGQRGYVIMTAAAVGSFLAAQFSSFDTENFFQLQGGFYNDGFDLTENEQIIFQNAGLEKRLLPWFALALEANVQQVFRNDYATIGGGLMSYYRWYAFGSKPISPFFEYGGGVFVGANKFPENGTRFTFRLVYKVGLELTGNQGNKLRLAFGHIHQSNNDFFAANPGYDGNGLTVSYSWFLD